MKYVQMFVPTTVLRWLIRLTFRYVGWQIRRGDVVVKQIEVDRVVRNSKPVTAEVEVTNEQLYANDPKFFFAHLGPMMKYSSCEWPTATVKTLADAEIHTISVYQKHVGLESLPKGARVLELGCGWGSLSLDNAAKFPHLNFVSFSNSTPQIDYIRNTAKTRGLMNITAYVEDYAVFVDPTKSIVAPVDAPLFDAAIAIETVEHAQNIRQLLLAVAKRLKPGSKFFVQSLLHQSSSYLVDDGSWMGRNFFTAGSILSLNSYFHLTPPELYITDMIPVNGKVR